MRRSRLNPEGPAELVLDKGYHSNDVLVLSERSGSSELLLRAGPRASQLDRQAGRESGGLPEPTANQGRAWQAAAASARRTGGTKLSLTCTKPEACEELTCGFTTTSSSGCSSTPVRSISSLMMRKISGRGTPRGFQGRRNALLILIQLVWRSVSVALTREWRRLEPETVTSHQGVTPYRVPPLCPNSGAPFLEFSSTTGC